MPQQSNKESKLPIFMQDRVTQNIILKAIESIPAGTKVYLVGGAARNAVYYLLFHKELPQRDFDLVVMGDFHKFIKNLRLNGFIYGKIRRKHQIVVKKKKIKKPKHRFKDYVFLDIKNSTEKSILKSLKREANFTINGFAVPLRSLNEISWPKKIIKLPAALKDLKRKRLLINALYSDSYNLFAAMRFMSKGFTAPPKKEIQLLFNALVESDKKTHKQRYRRNLEKLYRYVGGKKKAEYLLKRLRVTKVVLNLKPYKSH